MRWRWPPDSCDGISGAEPLQLHDCQQLLDALTDLRLRAAPHRQAEGDVVPDGHVLERRVVLEDEPDPAPLGADVGHVRAVDRDPPGIG